VVRGEIRREEERAGEERREEERGGEEKAGRRERRPRGWWDERVWESVMCGSTGESTNANTVEKTALFVSHFPCVYGGKIMLLGICEGVCVLFSTPTGVVDRRDTGATHCRGPTPGHQVHEAVSVGFCHQTEDFGLDHPLDG
jgi:hypothetical protein